MTYSEIEDLIADNLASGVRIPAVNHREVEMALLDYIEANLPKRYDTKFIFVDTEYLGDNFETSGLGKNERLGWAICNGATHSGITTPVGGKFFMAYGGDFTTLNQQGGYKDATLIEHEHFTFSPPNTAQNADVNATGYPISNSDGTGWGSEKYRIRNGNVSPTLGKSSKIGESGIGKNIPPFITLVAIMKL